MFELHSLPFRSEEVYGNISRELLCSVCLQTWLEAMDIQLPSWVPGLTRREIAWVRHGFLLPLRAASSMPKWEQGISCRCENIGLHRVCHVVT